MKQKILTIIACCCLSVGLGHAQEQVGDSEVVVTEKASGDWVVRCEQPKGGTKKCVMSQQTILQDSGQRLIQINIAYVESQEAPAMTIITPLGTRLPYGVTIKYSEEGIHLIPFSHCDQSGCFANQALTEDIIASFEATTDGQIGFQSVQQQTIDVPFSAEGFADALASLRS